MMGAALIAAIGIKFLYQNFTKIAHFHFGYNVCDYLREHFYYSTSSQGNKGSHFYSEKV